MPLNMEALEGNLTKFILLGESLEEYSDEELEDMGWVKVECTPDQKLTFGKDYAWTKIKHSNNGAEGFYSGA